MRRQTKLIIFSAAFLLVSAVSCKPRKAIELRESIVDKERVAFHMLADKNGLEEQKLSLLVKSNYREALALVDQQESGFNKLIGEIASLPAEGIKVGNELKTAAMNYYKALKELHVFSREEIAHQEASLQANNEELRAAQQKSLQLSLQKQDLFNKVYESERMFAQALDKFDAANGL